MKTSGLEQATLWVNQFGEKRHARGRSGLLTVLSATKATRMYIDKLDGSSVHCGYIVSGDWWTAYMPVEVPA